MLPDCSDPGKHPRLAGWKRLASTDPATVGEWWRRWPHANLGLVTGRRFDVLDLDGDLGVEALRAALSIAPAEHPGPVARTGGGGWHLLYAPTGLGNRVGLLPGVDWRGRDGLIVAPPSQHASGHRYTWVRPLTATLPEVPAGLRRLLAPPATARTTLPPATHRGRPRWRLRAGGAGPGASRRRWPPAPGRRNATLNRAAFNLGQLVAAGLLDVDQVRAVLLAAALEAGNPETKARATIESGLARRGGQAPPPAGRFCMTRASCFLGIDPGSGSRLERPDAFRTLVQPPLGGAVDQGAAEVGAVDARVQRVHGCKLPRIGVVRGVVAGRVHLLKVGAAQVGFAEVRLRQVHPEEPRVAKVGAAQVGAAKVSFAEAISWLLTRNELRR